MKTQDIQIQIQNIAKIYPQIKLVYLFGSRALGTHHSKSDYDFAMYLNEQSKQKRFELKLDILASLMKHLKKDNIDLVILNDTIEPEIRYDIVSQGKILFEEEPYKIQLEPYILNTYFDFKITLQKFNLTKAK